MFKKNKIVVESNEDILTNNLRITPEVKLNPIIFKSPPVINSEKPIFFGVSGKKSIILFTRKITKTVPH